MLALALIAASGGLMAELGFVHIVLHISRFQAPS